MQKHTKTLAKLPIALTCLVFLSSCGGGGGGGIYPQPDQPYTTRYPALAAHAAMDEEDFQRYLLTARRGTDITPESIKSLSVGSSINTAASTYNLRPIFSLGLLEKDGRLNVDTTRSQQKTTLRVTSSKAASTAADQFTFDVSASGSIGGEWGGAKASAAYHHASAKRDTKSDGSVSVQMVSANTNNIVSILGSGFTGSEDFTPYLLGTQLSDEQLRSYVATTESAPMSSCAGKPYITKVTVNRYKLADADPHANIQILSRMESVFGDLKSQHELCADPAIQSALVRQMRDVRGKIESAIADFYAVNGDAFISQTTSMNQAIGNGQLAFESADGNTESQNGGSLSAQYQSLTGGVGGSSTVQFYKQNGWAKALTKVQVSAEAKPAGVADTTAWVSSIQNMLKDQGSSLVPPMGNLPKDPGVKLPEPVGHKHDEDEPPDVAFTSYEQWKEYLADKKKTADDKKDRERTKKRVEEEKLNVNDDKVLLQSGPGGDAYQQVMAELAQLKERAGQSQPPSMPQAGAGGDNLVRFDKMFVNGFETMPYDAVIPQLRPDLDIPSVDEAIGSFPNTMEIMLVSDKLGRLDSYLTFLSSVSASNVTPQMSERYHQFFQKASSNAYDLVSLALSQGSDVTPAVLAGYKKAMFGSDSTKMQSDLYQSLQDIDYYDYVMNTLLDPVKGKAWSVAPGGYIPMRWNPDGSGGMQLVTWNALAPVKQGQANKEAVAAIDFTNPNADPLALYRKGMQTLQTPWYPVYVFNQSQAPTLVFMQYFGGYQAIYGPRWVTRPYDGETPVSPRLVPLWSDYQAMANSTNSTMHKVMTAPSNSFLGASSGMASIAFMDWNFSLHFPNSSGDPARLLKYNALLLTMPGDYQESDGQTMYTATHSAAVRDFSKAEYASGKRTDATYNAFRLPAEGHWMRNTSTGNLEDTAARWSGTRTSLVLLPINSNTTGESLKESFNYAPERATESIIDNNSLDLINKHAFLLK